MEASGSTPEKTPEEAIAPTEHTPLTSPETSASTDVSPEAPEPGAGQELPAEPEVPVESEEAPPEGPSLTPPPVGTEPGVGVAAPDAPASSDPAYDQAPVATDMQQVITGDPGLGEQQPNRPGGNVADQVTATSAPPPEAQSGVPLPEDRAAGVTPGTPGMIAPGVPPLPGSAASLPGGESEQESDESESPSED